MKTAYDDSLSTAAEATIMKANQPSRLYLDSSTRTNIFTDKKPADYQLSRALNAQLATLGIVSSEVYPMTLSDRTSDCIFDLDSIVYKPTGARVARAAIPNTFSTFDSNTNKLNLVTSVGAYAIPLPTDIRYTDYTTLKNEINAVLAVEAAANTDLAGISFDIDENIGKLVVTNGSAGNIALYPANTNLGFIHPHFVTAGATDTGLGIVLLNPYRSLYIRADFTSMGSISSLNATDILAEIPVGDVEYGANIIYEPQSDDPIGIADAFVTRVRMAITDFEGNLVDLKSRDWSAEIAISYD